MGCSKSNEIFEVSAHRGRVWVKRFLAELKRQEALGKRQPEEKFKLLLMESLYMYCDYISQCCGEIRNPNGTAWGWLSVAFVMMEQKIDVGWDCLCRAEGMFRKTASKIGMLEVKIGKGLAIALGLSKEPAKKVVSELMDTKSYVHEQKIQGKEEIVDTLIEYLSNKTGDRLPELLSEELQKPRNPT